MTIKTKQKIKFKYKTNKLIIFLPSFNILAVISLQLLCSVKNYIDVKFKTVHALVQSPRLIELKG